MRNIWNHLYVSCPTHAADWYWISMWAKIEPIWCQMMVMMMIMTILNWKFVRPSDYHVMICNWNKGDFECWNTLSCLGQHMTPNNKYPGGKCPIPHRYTWVPYPKAGECLHTLNCLSTQIAKFMEPTWGPSGAPGTLLSRHLPAIAGNDMENNTVQTFDFDIWLKDSFPEKYVLWQIMKLKVKVNQARNW